MKTAALSILLMAGAMLAGAANAQEAPAYMPPSAPPPPIAPEPRIKTQWSWLNEQPYDPVTRDHPIQIGVAALQDRKFNEAEEILAGFLRYKQDNASANFYMGVAKMNLGQWDDAKKHLEIAVRKKSKHPDPKSRLGVTYAKLGDIAGAKAQRADLVKMAGACKGDCRLSRFIDSGIEMIDEALAEPSGPEPAGHG